MAIDDILYGGRVESDHALENIFDMLNSILRKEFSWDIDNNGKPFVIWIFEYVKTLPTCFNHHNRLAANDLRFESLPSNTLVLYGLVDDVTGEEISLDDCNALSPAQAQDSAEGRATQGVTDYFLELDDRIVDVTWKDLIAKYERDLPFLKYMDVSFKNEDLWEGADKRDRLYMIKQTERQIMKRLCRKCMICQASLLTIAGRQMTGKHNHHVDESQKKFNPSKGPLKDIKLQRKEDRKTVCICGGCHMGVTHSKVKDAEFKVIFHNLGFDTQPDGEIVCHNTTDNYRVVSS